MSVILSAAALACSSLAFAPVAWSAPQATAAGQVMPFDQAGFTAAQKAGKPILVEITAPWCSTCQAQKPILSKLRQETKFKDLVTFNIDFDSQKALVRKFGATMQSTLIVYKGEKEAGRSAGETAPGSIASLLGKAI